MRFMASVRDGGTVGRGEDGNLSSTCLPEPLVRRSGEIHAASFVFS
jgi:hypothetical protein